MLDKTWTPTLTVAALLAFAAPVVADADTAADTKPQTVANDRLADILEGQSADNKARYAARLPAETMSFCELKEGDTVIETLPGGGWYSRILYPYLGKQGRLIGAQYPISLFERFGWDDKRLQRVLNRDKKWSNSITTNAVSKGGVIDIYKMTDMPDSLNGVADNVLFIRSLHNLNRFGEETGYLNDSLAEAFRSLKQGGIACVIQHAAVETASDDWANGKNGYLKKSLVVAAFKKAGFKLVKESDLHANPKDRPSETESVWRLPPILRGSEENSAERRAYEAIGESNRMTLKFVKPTE